MRGHEDEIEQHHLQRLKHLIRECNVKAKKERENKMNRDSDTNIKCHRVHVLKRENNVLSRSMQESMQIINSRKAEEEHGREKIKCKQDFIDKDTRNAFNPKKVTTSMMKCAHGFNHYSLRESLINKNMIDACYPRCQEVETWDYVLKCKKTISLRKKFIKGLVINLVENKPEDINAEKIILFAEDTLRCSEI